MYHRKASKKPVKKMVTHAPDCKKQLAALSTKFNACSLEKKRPSTPPTLKSPQAFPKLLSIVDNNHVEHEKDLQNSTLETKNPIETMKQIGTLLRALQHERGFSTIFHGKSTQNIDTCLCYGKKCTETNLLIHRTITDQAIHTIWQTNEHFSTKHLMQMLTKKLTDFRAQFDKKTLEFFAVVEFYTIIIHLLGERLNKICEQHANQRKQNAVSTALPLLLNLNERNSLIRAFAGHALALSPKFWDKIARDCDCIETLNTQVNQLFTTISNILPSHLQSNLKVIQESDEYKACQTFLSSSQNTQNKLVHNKTKWFQIISTIKEKLHCIFLDVCFQLESEQTAILQSTAALARSESEEKFRLLKQQEALQAALIANINHDLRTPLNALQGHIDLMRHPDLLPKEQNESLDTMQTCVNTVLDLIKNALANQPQDKNHTTHNSNCNLLTILQGVVSMKKKDAREKGLALTLNIDDNIDPYIISDKTKLTEIFLNLIGNAIKFTQKGSIDLSLKPLQTQEEKQENTSQICFTIHDTGIGIAPENIDKIFNRHTQATPEIKKTFGGSGLGLAISKNFITLMGGTIEVSSTLNVGTTFTCTIPFTQQPKNSTDRRQTTEKTTTNPLPSPTNTNQFSKILLVEDNKLNQKVAVKVLNKLGYQNIAVAENGEEALTKVKEQTFSLIFMDCYMPVMDGLEATKKIRLLQNPTIRNIPIIGYTASEGKSKCLNAGMDDCLQKPVKAISMQACLKKWEDKILEEKNQEERHPLPPAYISAPTRITPLYDKCVTLPKPSRTVKQNTTSKKETPGKTCSCH